MPETLDDELTNLRRINAELRQRLGDCTAERDEALAQRTAMAEVVEVISRSPGDLAPVFDAMLERAMQLCGAAFGGLFISEGERFHAVATRGVPGPLVDFARKGFPIRSGRLLRGDATVHFADLREAPLDRYPELFGPVDLGRARTMLNVALRKDDALLGFISLFRQEVRPFSDRQIALVQNFAAQGVIAMEGARLLGELRQRTHDLEEALEYQTATSDVLKVVSRSTFDLRPMLDTVIETAARLCGAEQAAMTIREGNAFRYVAAHATSEETFAILSSKPISADRGSVAGRVALEGAVVQVLDIATDPEYALSTAAAASQAHTVIGVPLLRDGTVVGTLNLARQRVEPFSERQIVLLQSFADQAVIAIENARLINETREALERQTATAEVLQVINASPGNLAPVFDAMLEKAMALCHASGGALRSYDGEVFHAVAVRGVPAAFAEFTREVRADPRSALGRIAAGEHVVQVVDLADPNDPMFIDPNDPTFRGQNRRAMVELGSIRTALWVALRKEESFLGTFVLYRGRVKAFSEREIALVENFAAQAVIAMENARLINETREALEQQTATAEVLQVINSSPGDLAPVFDAMLEKATRLCGAPCALLWTYDGEQFQVAATLGIPEEFAEYLRRPLEMQPTTSMSAIQRGEPFVHNLDLADSETYRNRRHPLNIAVVELGRARTGILVPLQQDGRLVGAFRIYRKEVRPFSEKQIALLQNFAAQAVVAMENARLLDEIRQRQAELRVTFDNMGDGVVMFDEGQRLAAWNRNFQTLLDLPDEFLAARPRFADYFQYLAARGEYASPDLEAELRRGLDDTGAELRLERTRPDGRVIEVRRNAVPDGGFVLIYSDITERKRSEAEIRAARDAAEAAYRDLKAAQASLVQAEKMASLGQLTAGIAHEIKNPLNFVNNFADLSVGLLDELKETAAPAIASLGDEQRAEVDGVIEMLTGNLERIAEHGRRADGIVKSMLEHSRGTTGERRTVDINHLVDEALNLAYHGARAQDSSFNITLERDFASTIPSIDLVPQDITRVCLNLISNGFYAATKRARQGGDPEFEPTLRVTTRDLGEAVEIRIRDNGIGMAPEVKDKLFQPFFTTKPTGEGTGLGLSISYDIVTQQHGGTIEVDTSVNQFTEFRVRLPHAPRPTLAQAAS